MTKYVSREIFQGYIELLLKWNNSINLISKNITIEELWSRHIYDCLSLLELVKITDKVIDVGSGGGFPGIILSLCGIKDITLIESDVRKSAFLLQASKLCDNKVTILNDRVENLDLECDILTSRAFAPISNILDLCSNIKVSKKCLFLKGKRAMLEIDKASELWNFNYKIHKQSEGSIVELYYDNIDCKPKRRGW